MNQFTISATTIGEAWISSIDYVLEHGHPFFDEDVDILEVTGMSLKIECPSMHDEIVEKLGDRDVIKHTLTKFKKGVEMPNRPFTYSGCVYNKNGVDQFEWLVDRLKRKPETKSATISLLTEGDENPNLPCLNIIDVKIRNSRLNLQLFFRSQNIVGRQYANLLALANFQNKLSERLSISNGFIAEYIASAHIYDYDLDFAKNVHESLSGLKDMFYSCGPKSIRNNPSFKNRLGGFTYLKEE